MKTFLHLYKAVFALICLLLTFSGFAQPDYVFKNATLLSGTDLQPGAIYRFQNVKPGVDARVEIINFTGGVSLDKLDEGWTGFDDAFQPFILVNPGANGYIEFEFRFYTAGTSTLMNQASVPMSPIDVDGVTYASGVLYETDQIQMLNGYYNHSTSTSEISVNQVPGWIRGRNISGWSYPGIDTAAKNVMFTVVNTGVNTIRVRIGANNSSTVSEVRYRSVYFKRFTYQNGILPGNPVVNFNGTASDRQVRLQYELSEPEKIQSVILEKANGEMKFEALNEIQTSPGVIRYTYTDHDFVALSYYRLRISYTGGSTVYSSVLKFNSAAGVKESFKIYPSLVNDQIQMQYYSDKKEKAALNLYDYNGRLIFTKPVEIQPGMNNTSVEGLTTVMPGNYIVVLKNSSGAMQQKIIKQ
jgi:hypothetical protein